MKRTSARRPFLVHRKTWADCEQWAEYDLGVDRRPRSFPLRPETRIILSTPSGAMGALAPRVPRQGLPSSCSSEHDHHREGSRFLRRIPSWQELR